MKRLIFTFFTLCFVAAGCGTAKAPNILPATPTSTPAATSSVNSQTNSVPELSEPISGALARVTKKTFGLYVSPGYSPVSPEKFTGFHTGIDFETTPEEQNTDVAVYAACEGKLLLKKYATGYGGIVVQACVLDDQNVTVIYGHLRLASILPIIGDELKVGDKIAVLGTGYSSETDGERKHLHFSIHKGTAINILGYVQKQADLSSWLNPTEYLR